MFLAYLVSAVLQVRILGGEEKKWHQDGSTVYERMSAKKRLEPCCPLQCLFVQGGQGSLNDGRFFIYNWKTTMNGLSIAN